MQDEPNAHGTQKTLLTEIFYARTVLIEYANKHTKGHKTKETIYAKLTPNEMLKARTNPNSGAYSDVLKLFDFFLAKSQWLNLSNSEAREWRQYSDKTQTTKLEWWMILKAGLPKTPVKRKLCLHSVYCWFSVSRHSK